VTAGGLEERIAESIAARVIEIVRRELGGEQPARGEWIDAAEVARRTGFSRNWVYENAGRLGAVRFGGGRRPRLRFDPQRVARLVGPPADGQSTGSGSDHGMDAPHTTAARVPDTREAH
jgi:hypothetical protein